MRYIDNGQAGAWAHSPEAVEYYTNLILTEYPGTPVNLGDVVEEFVVVKQHQFLDEDGLFVELIVARFECEEGHDHLGGFAFGQQLPGEADSLATALTWFEAAKESDPEHPNYQQYKLDNEFLNIALEADPGVDVRAIVNSIAKDRG